MPVSTARQKVLAFLARQRVASAGQIGHALNMSAATVRHHLSVMSADGRISQAGVRPAPGRGRPVKEFRLSEKILGDNLAFLAAAVLDEAFGKNSSAKRQDPMAVIGKRLAEEIGRVRGEVACRKTPCASGGKAQCLSLSSALGGGPGGTPGSLRALSIRGDHRKAPRIMPYGCNPAGRRTGCACGPGFQDKPGIQRAKPLHFRIEVSTGGCAPFGNLPDIDTRCESCIIVLGPKRARANTCEAHGPSVGPACRRHDGIEDQLLEDKCPFTPKF